MTTETERFVVPRDIVDEDGVIYFRKGAEVTQELLEAALKIADSLKSRISKDKKLYDAVKDVYAEWAGRYGDVVDGETGLRFTLASGGEEKHFDIRELAKANPKDVVELAERGFLTVKGASFDANMVKAALDMPGVHAYYHTKPKTLKKTFTKED